MREFTFSWNNGRGRMTLNLDYLLERKSNRFVHTTKPDVLKIMKYIITSDEPEKINDFLYYLDSNGCGDIAQLFREKHHIEQGGISK